MTHENTSPQEHEAPTPEVQEISAESLHRIESIVGNMLDNGKSEEETREAISLMLEDAGLEALGGEETAREVQIDGQMRTVVLSPSNFGDWINSPKEMGIELTENDTMSESGDISATSGNERIFAELDKMDETTKREVGESAVHAVELADGDVEPLAARINEGIEDKLGNLPETANQSTELSPEEQQELVRPVIEKFTNMASKYDVMVNHLLAGVSSVGELDEVIRIVEPSLGELGYGFPSKSQISDELGYTLDSFNSAKGTIDYDLYRIKEIARNPEEGLNSSRFVGYITQIIEPRRRELESMLRRAGVEAQ